MCGICLVENKAKSETISCGHSFHLKCLMKWWYTEECTHGVVSCPMCRFKPSNEELYSFKHAESIRLSLEHEDDMKKDLRKWFRKWGVTRERMIKQHLDSRSWRNWKFLTH